MKKYEINRKEFVWAEDFYELIRTKMSLPQWFGKNADALWDMLTGFVETPFEIKFVGFGKAENDYNKNIINLILTCFIDFQKQYPDKIDLIIE